MSYSEFIKEYEKIAKYYPIMSSEEQAEYVKKAKAGDIAARDRLVMSNTKLVANTVIKRTSKTGYKFGSLDFEDLFQEGVMGLIHAIQHFSPECGTKFSTYAVWWIDRYIFAAISSDSRLIKLPNHIVNRLITVTGVVNGLVGILEREPTEKEVIDALGSQFDPTTVKIILKIIAATHMVELDATSDNSMEGSGTLGDIIQSNEPSPEEVAIADDRKAKLLDAIRELNPREQAVLIIKWGLEDGIERGLEETAQLMFERGITNKDGRKISKQAVDQLEGRAMEKLRPKLLKRFPGEGGEVVV